MKRSSKYALGAPKCETIFKIWPWSSKVRNMNQNQAFPPAGWGDYGELRGLRGGGGHGLREVCVDGNPKLTPPGGGASLAVRHPSAVRDGNAAHGHATNRPTNLRPPVTLTPRHAGMNHALWPGVAAAITVCMGDRATGPRRKRAQPP